MGVAEDPQLAGVLRHSHQADQLRPGSWRQYQRGGVHFEIDAVEQEAQVGDLEVHRQRVVQLQLNLTTVRQGSQSYMIH